MSVYAFSTANMTAEEVEDRRKLAVVEFCRNNGPCTLYQIKKALGANSSVVDPLVHSMVDNATEITLADGYDYKVVRVTGNVETSPNNWQYAAELVA